MIDFEKLGTFYLGRAYDLQQRRLEPQLVLYDARHLVTHAVCVGMTGSGKTGLCIGLIEEAAIDGVPAIIIDPKGDLPNLLLTFPALRAEDFRPWINVDDARRKGLEPDAFAAQQAETWRKGLADWGQDGARIARLREAADFAVYTPGSSAGLSVSILNSLAAPPAALRDDRDAYQERLSTTVTSVLGLLGIDADPIRSREHILLSHLFDAAWTAGQDVNLADLVHLVQKPPLARIGVMDLEAFYPAQERFGLAMQLNSLLAAPGFASWLEGAPLDIQALLYTPQGRPRISIFSIGHLSDAERMFFVSLLLNQFVGWTRQQSGTTSLRALLYMDEIAGYCPPVANVPSKRPLLTLMKQARAFGVGVVLATQNPVDLDYKGLANAGTWFIGRLQTERDKARVLDGLEGAAASAAARFDRQACDTMLSQLSSRVFLLNNVHADAPQVFQTRWALSYLRGPLTREQIRVLMAPRREAPAPAAGHGAPPVEQPATAGPRDARVAAATGSSAVLPPLVVPRAQSAATVSTARPALPPDIQQYFLPAAQRTAPRYAPQLIGLASIYFADTKLGVDEHRNVCYLAPLRVGPLPVDWEQAVRADVPHADLLTDPAAGATYAELPPDVAKPRSYARWQRELAALLFRAERLELLHCGPLRMTSRFGEAERDFRLRLQQTLRERRDDAVARLREKYATRLAGLEDRLRRAQQAIDVQKAQSRDAGVSAAVSFGTAVLSAIFGARKTSAGNLSRAGTAIRGAQRTARETGDVRRAEQEAGAVRAQISSLEAKIEAEILEAGAGFDPLSGALETLTVAPRKTNISVQTVALLWTPLELHGRS